MYCISYNTGFIKHFSQIHLKSVVHKFFFSLEKTLKDYNFYFSSNIIMWLDEVGLT